MMNAVIEELQERFGPVISAGQGGLPRVTIHTPAASGEVYLHGAQVTSWQPAGCEEVLFVSKQSSWVEGRAIRGGIPVCFPWFRDRVGDPKAPSHGFVRTKAWELDSVEETGEVTLSTATDASTLAWWPHEFVLELRVIFGERLVQELTMRNTGDAPLTFEEALHAYYRVGAAENLRIQGLDGVSYNDNMDGNREKRQEGDIVFTAQTDRAYLNTAHAIEIVDPVLRRTIRIEKESSSTTVVWNPWSTGSQSLADLGDEWHTMACVEASNIRAFGVTLAPGAAHTMKTSVTLQAD